MKKLKFLLALFGVSGRTRTTRLFLTWPLAKLTSHVIIVWEQLANLLFPSSCQSLSLSMNKFEILWSGVFIGLSTHPSIDQAFLHFAHCVAIAFSCYTRATPWRAAIDFLCSRAFWFTKS